MPASAGPGEILIIKQVAAYLKVTERTIYRLAAARKIPAFKVGGTWRFSRADIERWISQQSAPSKPAKPTEGVRASKAHKTTSRRGEAR
jgi:excisionase family DNA binding protein